MCWLLPSASSTYVTVCPNSNAISEIANRMASLRGSNCTQEISPNGAEEIAGLLIARRTAEHEEEERIRLILSSHSIPAGKNVLVDGTGVRVL